MLTIHFFCGENQETSNNYHHHGFKQRGALTNGNFLYNICLYLFMNMEVTNWKELNSLLESLVKSFRNAPESADVMGSIHSGDENFKSLHSIALELLLKYWNIDL